MNLKEGAKPVAPFDLIPWRAPKAQPAEVFTGTPAELSERLGSLLMSLGSGSKHGK